MSADTDDVDEHVDEHVDSTSSIKVPLTAINWRPEYLTRLEELVLTVHYLMTHAYQLARWIYVFEPQCNANFDHGWFLDGKFFYHIFMSLANYKRPVDADDSHIVVNGDDEDNDYEDVAAAVRASMGRAGMLTADDCKALINLHIYDYCASARFDDRKYKKMSRVASYTSSEMLRAYVVNIKQHFGQRLRYAINTALNTRQRTKQMHAKLKGESKQYIRERIEREIRAPARDVKDAINFRHPICYELGDDGNPKVNRRGQPIVDKDKQRVINGLSPVLDSYSSNYSFKMDNIYYDIKASPVGHLRAFSELCKLIETRNEGVRKKRGRNKKANAIQCFPLRTSFVPCHMHLDPTIIRQHILYDVKGIKKNSTMKQIWSKVCSRKTKPFNQRRDLQFCGSADTDGVSISLKFKTTAVQEKKRKAAAKGAATRKAARVAAGVVADGGAAGISAAGSSVADGSTASVTHAAGTSAAGRASTHAVAVAMDVDGDDSNDSNDSSDGDDDVYEDVADDAGAKKKWPKKKAGADCLYVNQLPRKYLAAIRKRLVYDDMGRGDIHCFMHHLSTVMRRRVLRYTRKQRGKETCMWRFRKIREKVKKASPHNAVQKAENRLDGHDRASLVPAKYKAYVEARAREWDILFKFYSKTPTTHVLSTPTTPVLSTPTTPVLSTPTTPVLSTPTTPVLSTPTTPTPVLSNHQIHKNKPTHIARSYPLHRKLNLSAYINQQQVDYRLARNMRTAFGEDSIIAVGNWSASIARYHEPIRGKSWRDRLKRFGFTVYLIDEFRTSCVCPECNYALKTYKIVRNPRPYQREDHPTVICNGLLRCTNQKCLQSVDKYKASSERRYYNRNVAAVLNFRRIVDSLCETGKIPKGLRRSTPRILGDDSEPSEPSEPSSSTAVRGTAAMSLCSAGRRTPSAPVATMSMSLRSADKRKPTTTGKQPLPSKRSYQGAS